MSSSDEDSNLRNFRNVGPLPQFSPKLRSHAQQQTQKCPFCNSSPRAGNLRAVKSNNTPSVNTHHLMLSQSQHLGNPGETFSSIGNAHSFRFKNKVDFSDYDKKLKRAGKELERLNKIISDQSLELEALSFVKKMAQYEVDAVLVSENQRLKREIEDLQNQINSLAQTESMIDNSETFGNWNDRKDSERLHIDISNLDIDENSDSHGASSEPPNFEMSIQRIEEIKKLLIEDYRMQQNLSAMDMSNQAGQADEYSKKRAEIFSIFSKVCSTNPFAAANSPFIDRKALNVSRKHSILYDEMTPQNKSQHL